MANLHAHGDCKQPLAEFSDAKVASFFLQLALGQHFDIILTITVDIDHTFPSFFACTNPPCLLQTCHMPSTASHGQSELSNISQK